MFVPQIAPLEFEEGEPLKGTVANGRFGFSVAAIGDINKDGYKGLLFVSAHSLPLGMPDF